MKYKVSTYAKIHGVTMRTVWNWINKGELEIERTSTGRIRIVVDENKEKTIAVYARVSSSENKSNLIAQKDRVVSYCMAKGYKISKVVMEVGSGLNDKRPKLENLLKDNSIDIIVVEHKDRFSRFGFNFIQTLLNIKSKNSKRLNRLTTKRNNKVKDYLHKASTMLVNQLISNNVCKVVIGKNDGWKKEINIGKRNNQNFVNIPHAVFIEMVCYKCKLNGIEVVLREESYTSKCSFIDNEPIKKHDSYAGRRVKRGLFRSENGTFINADLNGALNILRKEVGEFNYNPIEVCSSPKKLRIGLS